MPHPGRPPGGDVARRQVPSRPALARDQPRRLHRHLSRRRASWKPKRRWPPPKGCGESWPTSGAPRSRRGRASSWTTAPTWPTASPPFSPSTWSGVNLAEPAPDSELAASRGWLDLVLAHELTHLFTLNAATEFGRTLRRVFGTLPVLYSTAQMPPWAIEGLAVYGESRFSGDGRLDHAPYRLMLAAARRDGLFPGWSRIDGLPAAWPGPAAKYLFGAGFMEFLAEKYGADRLRLYLDRVAARLLLISSSRDFENTFGEPLGKLWDEYRRPGAPGGQGRRSRAGAADSRGLFPPVSLPARQGRAGLFQPRLPGAGSDPDPGPGKRPGKDAAQNGRGQRHQLCREGKQDILFRRRPVPCVQRIFRPVRIRHEKRAPAKAVARPAPVAAGQKGKLRRDLSASSAATAAIALPFSTCKKGRRGRSPAPSPGVAQPDISPDGSMVAAAVKPDGGPWGIGLFSHRRRDERVHHRGRGRPQPAPLARERKALLHSRPGKRPRAWLRSPWPRAAAASATTRACRACGNSRFQRDGGVKYFSPTSAAAAWRSPAST